MRSAPEGETPPVVLLQPLDLPLDIEAPDPLPRLEPEALERDHDLRHPTLCRDPRARVPGPVPLVVEHFRVVGDLPVRPGARRLHDGEEPLRWSKKGSITNVMRSFTSRSASRASCVDTMAEGVRSWHLIPK